MYEIDYTKVESFRDLDNSAAKVALEAYGHDFGTNLRRNQSFDNMLTQLEKHVLWLNKQEALNAMPKETLIESVDETVAPVQFDEAPIENEQDAPAPVTFDEQETPESATPELFGYEDGLWNFSSIGPEVLATYARWDYIGALYDHFLAFGATWLTATPAPDAKYVNQADIIVFIEKIQDILVAGQITKILITGSGNGWLWEVTPSTILNLTKFAGNHLDTSVAYVLGNANGVNGAFTWNKGLATSTGSGNRATFWGAAGPDGAKENGSHVAGVTSAWAGRVFEGLKHGNTLTVAAAPINDGFPGSVPGTNSSTFGIFANPSLAPLLVEDFGYPAVFFLRK